MDSNGASERHQNNNLKVILSYVNYISKDTFLSTIKTCDTILSFSETKKKSKDPDQKWISKWNHSFHRIKHFFKWYHNCGSNLLLLDTNVNETQIQQQQFYENENQENWKSPDFLKNLKEKKTKRFLQINLKTIEK
jgi:hypothetical protein